MLASYLKAKKKLRSCYSEPIEDPLLEIFSLVQLEAEIKREKSSISLKNNI